MLTGCVDGSFVGGFMDAWEWTTWYDYMFCSYPAQPKLFLFIYTFSMVINFLSLKRLRNEHRCLINQVCKLHASRSMGYFKGHKLRYSSKLLTVRCTYPHTHMYRACPGSRRSFKEIQIDAVSTNCRALEKWTDYPFLGHRSLRRSE